MQKICVHANVFCKIINSLMWQETRIHGTTLHTANQRENTKLKYVTE